MNISTASIDPKAGPTAFRSASAALAAAKTLDGKKREATKKTPAPAAKKDAPKKKVAKKDAPKKKVAPKKKATDDGLTWTKAKVTGMRGERPAVLGVEQKSRMVRIDAAYADYLTKEAKRQGISITALTRKLVK